MVAHMIIQPKTNVIMPIISVILPVFNAEKYVEEAVLSILDQTFQNFELVIIDDGSTDGTLRILKTLKTLDQRVILITRENKGLIETLNEGIRISRGVWIARMDADDICDPVRIEYQLKYCLENCVDICGSHIEMFGVGRRRIRKYPLLDSEIKFGLAMNTQFAHPAVFGRSECFKSLKYSESYKHCEDYDLWTRAACSGYVLGNVDMVLLKYRLHPGQVSVTHARSQFLATLKVAQEYRDQVFAVIIDSADLLHVERNKSKPYPYFVVWQLLCIAKAYKCSADLIEDYLITLSKRDRSIRLLGIYECLGALKIFGVQRLMIFLRCVVYKFTPVELYAFFKKINSALYVG